MLGTETNGCLNENEDKQPCKVSKCDDAKNNTENPADIKEDIVTDPLEETKSITNNEDIQNTEENINSLSIEDNEAKQDLNLRINNKKKDCNGAKVKPPKILSKTRDGDKDKEGPEDDELDQKILSDTKSDKRSIKTESRNLRGKRGSKNFANSDTELGNKPGSSAKNEIPKSSDTKSRSTRSKKVSEEIDDDDDDDSEPRTSKRVRLQYQPFQSPETMNIISPTFYKPSPSKGQEEKIVFFNKGDFLAVRNELGTFYVCRTAQNVYKSSRKFKIQWLSDDKDPNVYIPDFYDQTDFECVLTNLKMIRLDRGKYRLPPNEKRRTMNILERAINVEKGLSEAPDPRNVVSDGVDVSIIGKEEEKELTQISPQIKRESKEKIKHSKSKNKIDKDGRDKKGELDVEKVIKKEKKDEGKEERRSTRLSKVTQSEKIDAKSSRKRRSEARENESISEGRNGKSERSSRTLKGINISEIKRPKIRISLIPNPKVTLIEKDPMFDSRDKVANISSFVDSRLLIRIVNHQDYELVDKFLSEKRISSFCVPRSVNVARDAFSYALQREDLNALKILIDEKYLESMVDLPDVLISKAMGHKKHLIICGQINKVAPQALEALMLDLCPKSCEYRILRQRSSFNSGLIQECLKYGVSQSVIEALSEMKVRKKGNIPILLCNNIVTAIKHGHRDLGRYLMKKALRSGGYGMTKLHADVLGDGKLPEIGDVNAKACSNHGITPLHCSAINPDPYYLSRCCELGGDLSIVDGEGWSVLHYASTCKGNEPLKYLLSRGCSTLQKDNRHNTPLHVAVSRGRINNVELILSHEANGDGLSCIEKSNKDGYTPLHLACEGGQAEIVSILLQSGADSEKAIAAGDHLTPLMVAARGGHLPVVKLLIEKGIDIETVDDYERTALIHAVMNGSSGVVSYLLRLGGNAKVVEAFGNSGLHYACGYGWNDCMKLMIEGGVELNSVNSAGVCAAMIAYLKGHVGILRELLSYGCTLGDSYVESLGESLIFETLKAKINQLTVDRIKLLADFKIVLSRLDRNGNNALHYLAQSKPTKEIPIFPEVDDEEFSCEDQDSEISRQNYKHYLLTNSKREQEYSKHLEELLKIFCEAGCSLTAKNKNGDSCWHEAVKLKNFSMIEVLLSCGKEVDEEVNDDGDTWLHILVQNWWENESLKDKDITNSDVQSNCLQEANVLDNENQLFDCKNIPSKEGPQDGSNELIVSSNAESSGKSQMNSNLHNLEHFPKDESKDVIKNGYVESDCLNWKKIINLLKKKEEIQRICKVENREGHGVLMTALLNWKEGSKDYGLIEWLIEVAWDEKVRTTDWGGSIRELIEKKRNEAH